MSPMKGHEAGSTDVLLGVVGNNAGNIAFSYFLRRGSWKERYRKKDPLLLDHALKAVEQAGFRFFKRVKTSDNESLNYAEAEWEAELDDKPIQKKIYRFLEYELGKKVEKGRSSSVSMPKKKQEQHHEKAKSNEREKGKTFVQENRVELESPTLIYGSQAGPKDVLVGNGTNFIPGNMAFLEFLLQIPKWQERWDRDRDELVDHIMSAAEEQGFRFFRRLEGLEKIKAVDAQWLLESKIDFKIRKIERTYKRHRQTYLANQQSEAEEAVPKRVSKIQAIPHEFKEGTEIYKWFLDGWFWGYVSYEEEPTFEKGEYLYFVKYPEDGDKEYIKASILRQLIKQAQHFRAKEERKKKRGRSNALDDTTITSKRSRTVPQEKKGTKVPSDIVQKACSGVIQQETVSGHASLQKRASKNSVARKVPAVAFVQKNRLIEGLETDSSEEEDDPRQPESNSAASSLSATTAEANERLIESLRLRISSLETKMTNDAIAASSREAAQQGLLQSLLARVDNLEQKERESIKTLEIRVENLLKERKVLSLKTKTSGPPDGTAAGALETADKKASLDEVRQLEDRIDNIERLIVTQM